MKCSNCNKEIEKGKKVGPELIYCDDECYLRDCIEKHPGTSLANIVARIRPDLAAIKKCESGQFKDNKQIWIYYEVNGVRLLKIKDLIKKLQELDGEKTIGIYDYEEDEEDLDLYVHKNIYADAKCDYLIE